ncbi:diacylglycerol kinase [Neisseria sp. Ec49-e6-T10]|uniref:diacylglycerol kinase n=1 Tax=Neisseria sp. Ec49-e6-T10 TaxID=3140744 RepID=UPI003EC15397
MNHSHHHHEPEHNNSPYKGKTGLKRIINAWSFSLAGLRAAFEEQGFRQLIYVNFVLIILIFVLNFGWLTKGILIAASIGTLIIELFNTSIEAAVDHTSLKHHPLAKRAKDTASAAQLLGLIILVILWICALLRDTPWSNWFAQ